MTRPMNTSENLDRLIHLVVEGKASDEQRRELADVISADAAVRRRYVAYTQLHAMLTWEHASAPAGGVTPASGRSVRAASGSLTRIGMRVLWLGFAACLSGAVIIAWQWWASSAVESGGPLATVTQAGAARWAASDSPVRVGDPVRAGTYDLVAGIVELKLDNGVSMVLEAPMKLEVRSVDRALLHSGRLVATVPPNAIGFTVDTPQASVVDLGTEFGVGVDTRGGTLVQVYDGEVVTETKPAPGTEGERRHLTEGKAVRIARPVANGSMMRELAFADQRFVRQLPDLGERAYTWLPPYNRSRYDRMHIVPAPANVVVDGDLAEWDLSGQFLTRLGDPYGEDYFVQGAMMHDERHLYIAAQVGDPAPMRSVIHPQSDPDVAWKGGSLQIRLTTDPSLGWPVDARSPMSAGAAKEGFGERPQDMSPGIVHLTMSYHRPTGEPCLTLSYGMGFAQTVVNPKSNGTQPNWRGAFRKGGDGRGYTLEYAIPWRLLNAAERPPQPGDDLGVSWQMHWSGEDGRIWRGHLVEIIRPDVEGHAFLRADMWGKAVYHPQGDLPPGTVKPVLQGQVDHAPVDRGLR